MRKLVLFCLLGGAFGLALVLDKIFSRPPAAEVAAKDKSTKAIVVLGGSPPRTIPESPPATGDLPNGAGPDHGKQPVIERPPVVVGPKPSKTHLVKKRETLSSIAQAELGDRNRWKELGAWNGIADPATLREGMTLLLAPPAAKIDPLPVPDNATQSNRTHTIEKGESLSKVAARYLGDAKRWRELQKLNGIADPAAIAEGTKIRLPER